MSFMWRNIISRWISSPCPYDTLAEAVVAGDIDVVRYMTNDIGKYRVGCINSISWSIGRIDDMELIKTIMSKIDLNKDLLLIRAACLGNVSLISMIIDDTNIDIEEIAKASAHGGHLRLVEILIQQGVSNIAEIIDIFNWSGRSYMATYIDEKYGSKETISI
jgi:hypothetical protein